MKLVTLLLFSLLLFSHAFAQNGKISGRVLDAKTHEPLPFANVYINNTTIGVTTDTSGKFTLPSLPIGSTEVVFSFIGYISQQVKIVVKETGNNPLAIQLELNSQQLSEVAIKSGRDKNWEKQLKRFEKLFFGNNANCVILNSWVIDFTEDNGTMKAKASLPLEIENRLLGYKLFFQLKQFGFSATAFSIVGNIRFVEMETTDQSIASSWMKNRERAYRGSAKFLMKSILDKSLSKQGFVLYKEKLKGSPRSDNFSLEIQHNLLPYDTASITAQRSGANEFRIGMKEKVEVHNKLDYIKDRFYTDVNNPVSWLEVRNGIVMVNQEGTILNPTDVAISGSMADSRVSGMLPLDYKPGSVIIAQSPESLIAGGLEEKVYLQTDKSCYYPGDQIWLSGFMNYRTPGLSDTLSKVLYVDLINPARQIVKTLILPLENGRAAGSFNLPQKTQPGNYVIRAYTQWMRNYGIESFFYKPVKILNILEGVDVTLTKPVSDNLLKISLDNKNYKTRSKVKMRLSLDSASLSNLTKGSFSIAVFDESMLASSTETTTIKNNFDLSEPTGNKLASLNYPIEKGLTLEGIYQDKKGKAKKTKLTLLPENMGGIYQASTSASGEFSLKNLVFYDSTKFVVQPSEGKVLLTDKDLPLLPDKLPALNLPVKPLKKARVSFTENDSLRINLLEEFNVKGKKTVKSENSYAQADFYIKGENMGNFASTAEVIAAKVPGLKLIFDSNNWFLVWARGTITGKDGRPAEPNLYVDNVMVIGETAGNRLFQINPVMIDHIEVNGMISANQGANGANGLVNVFTRKINEVPSRDLSFFKAKGFDRPATFPSPNYEDSALNSVTRDARSTLYWNPEITIFSPRIPVELSFFTSDQSGNYRIIVEGITNRGNTIHSETVFLVTE